MSRPPGVKRRLVNAAQRRALKFGLPFELTVAKLEWPDMCPVLGIKLNYVFSSVMSPDHPSLDQTKPRGGYTLANTRVISKRANHVKGNATAAELFAVARYMTAGEGLQPFIADGTLQPPNSINPIGDPQMSENLRVIALTAAAGLGDAKTVLAGATAYHTFLTGGAATPAAAAGAGKPAATTAAAGKAATGKKPTPEEKAAAALAAKQAAEAAAEDAGDGTDAEGPTKEEAGAAIKALMAANLREQAKELLAEFGAAALSGLKPEDYGAFIEKANELLMAA